MTTQQQLQDLGQEKKLTTVFLVKYIYAARLRDPAEIINNRKSWSDLDPRFQVALTKNWDLGFQILTKNLRYLIPF